MKRIYYWNIIIISLVALYFNTGFYLSTAISNKYEVEHPRIMYGNDKEIEERERELNKDYYLAIAIYIACFAGIGSSIYGLSKSKKK
jgi:uncharacterized membrane protein